MINTLRQFRALITLTILELYRRRDLLVMLLLSVVILLPLTLLTPFGVSGAGRYLHEIALLLIWLFSIIISLALANRLFPPEFENRTIYPLLAKPVSRTALLLGKYCGALCAAGSALAIFYLLYGTVTALQQGVWFPPIMLQAFIMHLAFIALITALSLTGSLLLTPAANLTLSGIIVLGMLLFGQQLPQLASSQPEPLRALLNLCHWIAPHLEFFDLRQRVVHVWSPVAWRICLAALLYSLLYTTALLSIAATLLQRKKL